MSAHVYVQPVQVPDKHDSVYVLFVNEAAYYEKKAAHRASLRGFLVNAEPKRL